MAEAYLYLLRADFLLGEDRRVRVPERVKSQVSRQVQSLLEVSKDMRHSGQSHRLRLIAQRAENVIVLCERNTLPQEARREFLPPCEEILHSGRG